MRSSGAEQCGGRVVGSSAAERESERNVEMAERRGAMGGGTPRFKLLREASMTKGEVLG